MSSDNASPRPHQSPTALVSFMLSSFHLESAPGPTSSPNQAPKPRSPNTWAKIRASTPGLLAGCQRGVSGAVNFCRKRQAHILVYHRHRKLPCASWQCASTAPSLLSSDLGPSGREPCEELCVLHRAGALRPQVPKTPRGRGYRRWENDVAVRGRPGSWIQASGIPGVKQCLVVSHHVAPRRSILLRLAAHRATVKSSSSSSSSSMSRCLLRHITPITHCDSRHIANLMDTEGTGN